MFRLSLIFNLALTIRVCDKLSRDPYQVRKFKGLKFVPSLSIKQFKSINVQLIIYSSGDTADLGVLSFLDSSKVHMLSAV
jgi:hypothetical protein